MDRKPSGRPRLLIVDDEPRNREKYLVAAKDAGFKKSERRPGGDAGRGGGADGHGESFHVALIDLILSPPREDGLDLIAVLSTVQPDCCIIAITRQASLASGLCA